MKRKMPETEYRGSRLCRILGNPTAYQIIKQLVRGKASPSELQHRIGVSLPTISETLRHLRNVDLVRYETTGNKKIYSLKDAMLTALTKNIEAFVQRMRVKKW
jgi:DNA-binding transcriptional ArsR family regulator